MAELVLISTLSETDLIRRMLNYPDYEVVSRVERTVWFFFTRYQVLLRKKADPVGFLAWDIGPVLDRS